MIKAGPFTRMVVFDIGEMLWFPVNRSERGDPKGVPLLMFYYASRWHENVPRSSLPVLPECDEETCWGFCSSMSHVSASKG